MTDEAPPKHETIDALELARLATLPENEWRLEITRYLMALKLQIDENTVLTASTKQVVNNDLKEIKEVLTVIKGGLVFFGWIGKIVKWFGVLAAAFTALVAAMKAGEALPQLIGHVLRAIQEAAK